MNMNSATKIPPTPAAYTVAEFGSLLRIGHVKTHELIRTGAIRSYKIGAKRLIPAGELDRFIGERLAHLEDAA
jgi:excisionase family DNA binding protein